MHSTKSMIAVTIMMLLGVASASGLQSGCRAPCDEGRVLDIPVEPGSGESLTEGIVLDELVVTIGTLEKDFFDWETGEVYHAGDCCLRVSGCMRNSAAEEVRVGFHATAYDASGRQVADTLRSRHLGGYPRLSVSPGSSSSFYIALSWSDSVQRIVITGYANPSMWPYSPWTSSTPLPESEITSVILSRQWVLENDTEPNPGTVRIMFPTSWLEEPPPIPEGEEAVELSVPTRLLLDSNTSQDPDELTVTLPNRYFDGL